jgi:hypothetical protein
LRHNDFDDGADREPIVVTIRALTAVTAFVDEAGDFVCVELPGRPRSVMVAATEAATEELVALLIGKLREMREMRAKAGDQSSERPRRALSSALASEITPAADITDRPL